MINMDEKKRKVTQLIKKQKTIVDNSGYSQLNTYYRKIQYLGWWNK